MMERESLICELINVKREIEAAKMCFDYADSDEMADYFIYKQCMAEKKYDCLLKLAKKNKIKETEFLTKNLRAV